ncbi:MAG: SMC-Scp complex subunit ScpB, partial [Acidimicrobiia bacterium]|nr:SMC-Scp complex subunit ScpB [Acidimicrobiia bacterium]
LRTLERRGFIREIERLPLPGNPAVYGTTPLFMEKLGLRSLAELPPLADHVPPASVVETLEETFRPNGQ